MKKALALMLLLAIMPVTARTQWSLNLNYGWLDNATPDWAENGFNDKPFSLWGNGWQAGGGLEYRLKDWLALGGSAAYQAFGAQPAGSAEVNGVGGQILTWTGESSWQAPACFYVRLIRPRAILGTNLKLGLGVMASHIGQLTVISVWDFPGIPDTTIVAGTGETIYRPYGQIGVGIKVPITARFGITADYTYLSTFDRRVAETPLVIGLQMVW